MPTTRPVCGRDVVRILEGANASWKKVAEIKDTKIKKLERENEELYNQVAALNNKIESLGKCGLNGTYACSYDNPGDVCNFHSPTVTKYRVALENIIQYQSTLFGRVADGLMLTKIAKEALKNDK